MRDGIVLTFSGAAHISCGTVLSFITPLGHIVSLLGVAVALIGITIMIREARRG